MVILFSQLERITGGKNLLMSLDSYINSLCIDSRKATDAQGTLFFAIKGERNDGHEYIHRLYALGVRQFVVEHPLPDLNLLEGSNIIIVSSSVEALQKLAAHRRANFTIPVIGVTGSNGKTIIKEWLYQILSTDQVLVKNPGSYNSQVGVPLSVWQIQPYHQLGIFEAGISRPDEMDKLEKVIQPTIGIFTNIGSSHSEGFGSLEEKIVEKLKLFRKVKVLIYCRDHDQLDKVVSRSKINTFSWGNNPLADLQIEVKGSTCTLQYKKRRHQLNLPFSDKASVENCLHCVALLVSLGYDFSKIQEKIVSLRSIPMRMELKEGINHCQLVDDTYNNDLGGLALALQFLTNQQQKEKKCLILSDILESGLGKEELVRKITSLVQQSNIHRFIGIGPVLSEYKSLFPETATFYQTTNDFLEAFDFQQLHQEIILVKGARVFAFERIVNHLQRKVHSTIMEIDLDSLIHNLNYFKARLRESTKVMVMVKAFAYGSGSTEIANVLQYHKVDYLGVAYADEGIELRKNNIRLPIMVMNPSEESFEAIVNHSLEPEIYSFRIFRALLLYLQGKACDIHLKLDTGMHRLGFEEQDIKELVALLELNSNIRVASIFSHLAGADESGHDKFSGEQASRFIRWADQITDSLGYKPLYHILNSPGILRLPEFQFDMVRLGIGLYGVDPTSDGLNQLRPVATLKTIISQIKRIKRGESIGYGRTGIAHEDTTIATIAIGYADGFSRAFSRGVGEVMVNGKRAKVIGNVCMDMTMIDITEIKAAEGDDVILFGKDFPIREIAEKIGTIPYEILTSTSERVKRVFVADGI
jgi:alanine racemase